jgi:hypothetical protein
MEAGEEYTIAGHPCRGFVGTKKGPLPDERGAGQLFEPNRSTVKGAAAGIYRFDWASEDEAG